MKKLLKNSIWLLVCFALSVGFSAWVDPANLVHSEGMFADMLAIMQSGKNIDGVSDYSDRAFKQYAAAYVEKPDTLVIGSSRSAQVDSSITGDRLWNASVTGATLADCCAVFQVYSDAGKLGERIILNVDSWAFDRYKTDARTGIYLADAYNAFAAKYMGLPPQLQAENKALSIAGELCSFGYFQSAVKYLPTLLHSVTLRNMLVSERDETDYGMLRSDGSYLYPNSYVNAEPLEVLQRAMAQYDSVGPALETAGGLDPSLQAQFEALCAAAADAGCELVLLLSPIHPALISGMEADGTLHYLAEVEDYVRAVAAQHGATVVGSYFPEQVNYDESAFLDALHISYFATVKLFRGKL